MRARRRRHSRTRSDKRKVYHRKYDPKGPFHSWDDRIICTALLCNEGYAYGVSFFLFRARSRLFHQFLYTTAWKTR